jgi:hypothetical protein
MILKTQDIQDNIDFIGVISSSWHFDNLLAFILYKKLSRGILFVAPQSNIKNETKYRIKKQQIEKYNNYFERVIYLNDTILKADLWHFFIHLLSFYSKKKELYIINPNQVNLGFISIIPSLKRKFICVSIDEGIGQYMSKKEFIETQLNGKLNNSIKFKIKRLVERNILLLFSNRTITYSFYKWHDNMLFPNNCVVDYLKKIYSSRTEYQKTDKNAIIFFKDFNVVSDHITSKLLNRIITFIDLNKYELIIKKHPNDVNIIFDKLYTSMSSVQVIRNTISGEELVSQINPKLIISGFSTVTFSCSFIFNIRVLSVINLYSEYDELSDLNKKIINNFTSLFGYDSNLIFLKNNSDFEKYLCAL